MLSVTVIRWDSRKEALKRRNEILEKMHSNTTAGRAEKAARKAFIDTIKNSISKIDYSLCRLSKYSKLLALGYAAVLALIPGTAFAAAEAAGGVALIKLMQQASFWVGLGVVIWGIVEAQLDLPGWKSRILKGILGYVAILLVPVLFISLRDNLQIDVWQELNGK